MYDVYYRSSKILYCEFTRSYQQYSFGIDINFSSIYLAKHVQNIEHKLYNLLIVTKHLEFQVWD